MQVYNHCSVLKNKSVLNTNTINPHNTGASRKKKKNLKKTSTFSSFFHKAKFWLSFLKSFDGCGFLWWEESAVISVATLSFIDETFVPNPGCEKCIGAHDRKQKLEHVTKIRCCASPFPTWPLWSCQSCMKCGVSSQLSQSPSHCRVLWANFSFTDVHDDLWAWWFWS